MAIAALQFYAARLNELDAELTDNARLHSGAARQVAAFATERLVLVASPQQSADLIASRQPSIVISSSGMATGGRVLRHLAATLPDSKNTVLFVGYQSAGTRGRALVEGAKEVRMLGRSIPVAAQIERLDSMSAHADAGDEPCGSELVRSVGQLDGAADQEAAQLPEKQVVAVAENAGGPRDQVGR